MDTGAAEVDVVLALVVVLVVLALVVTAVVAGMVVAAEPSQVNGRGPGMT